MIALRNRQMRNFLATLFLSQGVPMLQAGDEFGRTQRGNNNAYCQDNEISWVDWRLRGANHELLEFVRLLAQLRRRHAEFRRETFLKGAASRTGVKDVTWLNVRGTEMTQSEWQDANLRTLGIWFGEQQRAVEHLLLLVNAADCGADLWAARRSGGRTLDLLVRHGAESPRGEQPRQAHELSRSRPSSVALLEC